MASEISPRAEISPKAKIGDNCKIFPFVYIEDDVEIGDNCIIFPFVSILSGTRMGKNNKVHQGSVIAALPQDFEQFPSVVAQYVVGGRFGLMFGQVVVDSLLENLRVASPYEKHLVVVVEAGVWRVAYRSGNHDERQLPAVALVDVDGILQPVELQVLDACQFEAVGFVERDGCLVVLEAGSEHDDTCLFELELGVVEVSFWRGCLHGGGGVAG